MLKVQMDRQTTVSALVSGLHQEFLLGVYENQAEITETEIALKYHVSRSTVRTAMNELISSGLIEVRPNGRKYVKRIDQKFIEDLCRTRSVLEAEAARIILDKEDNDFSRLLSIVGDFYTNLQEQDLTTRRQKMAVTNELFHDQLFVMSDNSALIQCRRTLAPILSTIVYFNASLDPSMNVHGYYESHLKIARMLMDRDPEAVEYVRFHALDATMKDILEAIEKEREKMEVIQRERA